MHEEEEHIKPRSHLKPNSRHRRIFSADGFCFLAMKAREKTSKSLGIEEKTHLLDEKL
jgi:hypothetical protein